MSTDTLDIKELLNKVGWIAFLAGKTSPDDENKDNYYKQSEISIKRAEQALNLYIEERVREGKIEELNKAKEWCSGDFMCNYQDILDRLKELENTLPRGLKGDI